MRLIDADALMETLKILRDGNKAEDESIETSLIAIGIQEAYCSAIEAVQDAPTIDAVPVVRCEDCQYWQPPTYQEQEDGSTVGHCTAALNGQQTDAYWFCADGTR